MRCYICCRILPKLHGYLLPCFMLMIAGCASQQPISDRDRAIFWEAHQNKTYQLNAWRLAGRMSVRLEDEAWSASLYWQQDNNAYNLRIIAPLARGSVEIKGDSESVTLKAAEDQIYSGRDVDSLMQERLGWSVPISAMGYWIKGLPEPGVMTDKLMLDDRGRLVELLQSNWNVIYQSYTRSGGYQLPSRLEISREGITLRLRINSWNITNE